MNEPPTGVGGISAGEKFVEVGSENHRLRSVVFFCRLLEREPRLDLEHPWRVDIGEGRDGVR